MSSARARSLTRHLRVDSFEQALGVSRKTVARHDLLEGSMCAGLVSDVLLYDEYPSRYTDISRRHRWIRGDWQIAPWLLPRVPGADGRRVRNLISDLSRWKILDNLRRSLVPAAMMVVLLSGWLLPGPVGSQTLVVLLILVIPALLGSIGDFIGKPPDLPLWIHLRGRCAVGCKHLVNGVYADLPALRGVHQSRCHRSHGVAASSRRRLMNGRQPEAELNSGAA
jgi:hypothetical protein